MTSKHKGKRAYSPTWTAQDEAEQEAYRRETEEEDREIERRVAEEEKRMADEEYVDPGDEEEYP